MNIFELFATISLTTSGFTSGLKNASDAMQSFGDRVGAIASTVGKAVETGLAVASAAAVKFAKDSVDVGKQFDAAMANVSAISGATGEALNDLRETAIAMGGSTRFSATEAADALGYMAMAGWEPKQMMDGLKGVMDLAAASGTDLATTADIVTDALTAFGLKAEDSAHFADVLAVASSTANTNVSMMGETFKYVAPLAGTLGYNIEDMAVSIGLMANAGIKASQAGTSLRAGLSKLVKPSNEAMEALKKLGLTVQEMSDEEIAAKTAALEKSVTARERAYSDEEDALQESLDKQYDALKKSLDARYEAAKETYDSEYDALKKSLDKQYDAQKEAFDEEYEERKKTLDKAYDAAKDTYDKEYEERKKSLEAAYDALEKTLDDEVEAMQAAHEKTLADTQKAKEEEVKVYEKATEEKLALIDTEYRESLKNTDKDEYDRLKKLDDEIAKIQAESDKAAQEAEENERKQRRAELQAAIDNAKNIEARHEARKKLSDYEEKIRQKDAEAKRKADIADLKAKKEQVKEEAKTAREAAKEKYEADTKETKEGRAEVLEQIKEWQKEELATLKANQKEDLKALKESRKEQLEEKRESNATDLKELKALNDERLDSISELNKSELKELKDSHADQLSALKDANSEQLKELSKAHSNQLSAIKDGNEDKLKEAQNGYSKQLQALKDHHKDELKEYKDSVKQQTEALKKQGEARAAVLTDENGNTRDLINFDKEHLGLINILREKFKGMTEAEQSSTAAAIFGQEAMSGWLAILNASDEDFAKLVAQIDVASVSNDKFAEAMKNNGFSADAMRESMARLGVTQEEFDAALKQSNGKVKDFREALQKAADSGTTLDDIDGNLTMSVEELTNVFGKMSAAAIMAGTHEDSLAGSATTLGSAIETLRIRIADKLNPTIREFTKFGQESVVSLTKAFEREESVNKLSAAIHDAEGNLLSAGRIAGVLSETLYSMSEEDRQIAIRELFGTDDIDYVNSLLDENGEKWDELLGYVSQIDAVAESSSGLSGMMDALGPIISKGIGMILKYVPDVVKVGGQLLGALVNGVIENLPLLASGAWQIATELGNQLLNAAPDIAAKGGELLDFIVGGIIENVDMLADTAINLIDTFAGFLADAIPSVAEKLTDVVVEIADVLSDPDGLENLAQSALAIIGAISDALITNVPRLGDAALKLLRSFGGMLIDHADELVDTALNLIDAFAGFLGEAIPDFLEIAADVIIAFAESLTDPNTLSNLANSALAVLEGLADGIANNLPRFAETAINVLINFGEYLWENKGLLLDKAFEIAGTLVDAILESLDIIGDKLAEKIPALSFVFENLETIVSAVVGGFAAFQIALGITSLIGTFTKFIEGATIAFKFLSAAMLANPFVLVATLIGALVAALVTLWNTNEDFRNACIEIWEAIKKAFSDAWNAITELWSAAGEWFAGVRQGIEEAFANIGAWFSEKFTAAYNAVTGAWSGAKQWASDRWTDISNAFQSAGNWFSDTFSKAWNGVTEAFGGVKTFFDGVWDDITGAFSGAFEWFKGIGKNIIDGLTEGIGGLWSGFINFLSGKTDEVKDEFEGEQGFDTHSPSKWSEKVFRNILEGGEIGFERGLPAMLSSAKDAVSGIQDALSADPFSVSGSYQLSGGYSYAQTPQLAAAGGGYGGAAPQFNITIEPSQVILDKRIVGEILWRYVKTQQRARGQ